MPKPRPRPAPIRIAIVGTGLAGLAAAHLLQTTDFRTDDGRRAELEVHVFEKAAELGMDAASLSVKTDAGTVRVDAPMRSINRGSHARVHALYTRLGVRLRRLDFGYAFTRLQDVPSDSSAAPAITPTLPSLAAATATEAPPAYSPQADKPASASESTPAPTQTTQFLYEGSSGLRWPPLAVPSHLLPSLHAPSPLPLLRHLLLLARLALAYVHLLLLSLAYVHAGLTDVRPRPGPLPWLARRAGLQGVGNEGLRGWCVRHGVWGGMVDDVLVPLWAAVATVDKASAESMPVGEVLQYIASTFGAPHYVARDGVRAIVRALAAPLPLDRQHLNTTLTSLAPAVTPAGRPRTLIRSTTDGVANDRLAFDHIILATQANQARALLGTVARLSDAARGRIDALAAFGYVSSLVVTHSDEGVLPPDRRDVRDLNFASFERAGLPGRAVAADAAPTANVSDRPAHQPRGWIQATHVLSPSPLVLQTTNPLVPPDPARVLRASWFERAVVSPASRAALPGFLLPDEGEGAAGRGREGEGRWQGVDGVWLVGSWAAEGCPLLEGCVVSAERVVRAVARRERWGVLASGGE